MKAILKFIYDADDPDECQKIRDMQNVYKYKSVLQELDNFLRKTIKYDNNLTEEVISFCEDVRETLHSELDSHNITLDD